MPESPEDSPALVRALRDLLRWFAAARVPGVVIGGVAVSLLARPRTTVDVDALVLVEEPRWRRFLEAGKPFGIRPRIRDALAFAGRSRVLLLVHEPTGVPLDCSLGLLPFEERAVRRRIRRRLGSLLVPLPRPGDLLVMKALAGRARDHADIESLVIAFPRLRLAEVRRTVAAFSEALETPGILEEFEATVRRARRA